MHNTCQACNNYAKRHTVGMLHKGGTPMVGDIKNGESV